MSIIALNFTKISAEKMPTTDNKLKISNHVAIKEVERANLSLGAKAQNGLKFTFQYQCKYEPQAGSIELLGTVITIDEPKVVEDVMNSWKKDKKVPSEIMKQILNAIVLRGSIQGLILSKEINLPPPVPMPKVSVKE